MKNIILASASPRRKELMTQVGFTFRVQPSNNDEIITKNNPEEIVKELSYKKAKEVFEKGYMQDIVIGADTIVIYEEKILGKPKDEAEAYAMINRLQGNTHQVYTGVSIIWKQENNTHVRAFAERTDVELFPMSDKEIREYVSTKEPFDKAGGYGIQGCFASFVKRINGDYNNVVGLPVARLYQELKNEKLNNYGGMNHA